MAVDISTNGTQQGSFAPPGQQLPPEQLALLPHDNAGRKLLIFIWVFNPISFAFLALRICCKLLRKRSLWWDDYILIVAWLCILTESALLTCAVEWGYGAHIWDFSIENTAIVLPYLLAAGSTSMAAAMWSKTSFALTIFRLSTGWLRWVIIFIMVSMNILMGLSIILAWFQCTPVQKSWNPMIEGTCWPQQPLVYYDVFTALYSGLMDVTLALIPWAILSNLRMNRKERIGVSIAMSMGVFAGATAFVKTSKVTALLSPDPYDGIDLFIWGNAESTVTIIAASIPVLRVLIREVKGSQDQTDNSVRWYFRGGRWVQGSSAATAIQSTDHQGSLKGVDSEKSLWGQTTISGRSRDGEVTASNHGFSGA